MWTEALAINWMDSLVVIFVGMMAVAGGLVLWAPTWMPKGKKGASRPKARALPKRTAGKRRRRAA